MEELRDTLRECANSIDEIIKIDAREKNGEKVTNEEKENAQGKMIMKFIKMQQLAQNI